MRTQDQNPAFQRFRHLLPGSGLYPAAWVDIFSNTDDATFRYRDVEVVYIPRGKAGGAEEAPELDRDFWNAFAAYNEQWIGDLGNSVMGWMEPGGLTPEGVFGGMLATGFVNQAELNNAIAEFAHIEECEWARRMRDDHLLADELSTPVPDTGRLLDALARIRPRPGSEWATRMAGAIEAESHF